MNIVLVRPPAVIADSELRPGASPPLGLAYVAASLQAAGHRVTGVDTVGEDLDRFTQVDGLPGVLRQGLSDDEILARVPEDADIVGLSCMFSTEWLVTRALIQRLRDKLPHAKLIAGGEHITACPEFVLQTCPALDCCGLGEGDELLVEFARAVEQRSDWAAIAGLVFRDGSRIVRNAGRKRVRDVDSFPRPAWELFPIRNYIDKGAMPGVAIGRSMPIMASRGCPYKCTFCSNPQMWGNLWRARRPESVLAEMIDYKNTYNVTNFDFYDLTAIVQKEWTVAMARLIIDNDLQITWQLPSGTRSEALDREVVDLLYRSGCRNIIYAPEHGSSEMLELIKKRINKKNMLRSVRGAFQANIKTKANFIVGFPDEQIGHVLSSYWFAMRMAMVGLDDVSFFPFSPYPGSELFNRLKSEGKIDMSDRYFANLIKNPTSFSHLPGWLLPILAFVGIGLFYLTSFALRPQRVYHLAKAVWTKRPETRMHSALLRVLRARRTRELAPAPHV
jgi:anaerobic magnesium-protoporphyrin IX monomethyl ester cyclase